MDFYINYEEDRDFKILFLADTQLIDGSQMRTIDRLKEKEQLSWARHRAYDNCFCYIEECVKRSNPELIVIVGDLVYGEFDDTGASLLRLINYMDSFDIPWTCVFGNHENESFMGVDWQVDQLTNAKNCLFKRGNVTGNSNFTIGIKKKGKLIRRIFMIDSNGCGYTSDPKIERHVVIREDQVKWIESMAKDPVPSFACYHIPTKEFGQAYNELGYHDMQFEIEDDGINFGKKYDVHLSNTDVPGLLEAFKKNKVNGVFVGHHHTNSTSLIYKDIRWTFVLKTGTYDYHRPDMLGGSLVTINGKEEFKLEHIYCEKFTPLH